MLCFLVFSLFLSNDTDAEVVASIETDVAPNGTGSYTPAFPSGGPSSSDIIEGSMPVAVVGNFTLENSAGVIALTNGSVATAYGDGTGNSPHAAYATGGDGGGTSITYSLAGFYNLSSMVIYGGWNDAGRDAQHYNISTSADAGQTFNLLTTFDNSPGEAQGVVTNPVSHRVAFTEDTLPSLATGVTHIRLDFLAVENAYTGYTEIDVFGAEQFLPGDANRNGIVDINDFYIISDHLFSMPSAPGLDGDVVVDNFVDVLDFRLWKDSVDAATAALADASHAVPEPASGILLGLVLALFPCVRRHRC
ncbi:MAG: hypothetical protein JW829_00695 [Pirellulales bacterium]|nr:hypothetical protein [Pirellulales bacterium]